MHKRKDYYHAGGDNGKKISISERNKPFIIDEFHKQPPDKKPSFFKRIAKFWKGRTEAQKGQ